MRRVDGLENLGPGPERSVITVGKFFALHRGHQALIRVTCERALSLEAACVVLTFDRHPLEVLRPSARMPILAPVDERLALMEALGVDLAVIIRVTPAFLSLTPEEFVRDVLRDRLHALAVFCSASFRFGRGAQGMVQTLRELGARYGLEVREVAPVLYEGAPISSSRVALALRAGRVQAVRELLGRPYAVRGRVLPGDARGRELGFPTANLELLEPQLLPADGVYVAVVTWDGEKHLAVVNLGVRPTVGGSRRTLEAHLLDFEGDVYGRELTLYFCHRLRDEQRFPSLDALKEQIARDVEVARQRGPCV
ncbi:MAG: bifunctional riboflavin kinase/FAD synthetase [Armatimonadetes bacterium]|nr:bifunctional riboflavin kinase/FAD synthetase [Armatimonadota bacterium]